MIKETGEKESLQILIEPLNFLTIEVILISKEAELDYLQNLFRLYLYFQNRFKQNNKN